MYNTPHFWPIEELHANYPLTGTKQVAIMPHTSWNSLG